MHVSCIQAGTLLARLARPEVMNCIAGLEQYSYSYEEAGDQAVEMKRLYNMARAGEIELNLAAITPRGAGIDNVNHTILVDDSLTGGSDNNVRAWLDFGTFFFTYPEFAFQAFATSNTFSPSLYG